MISGESASVCPFRIRCQVAYNGADPGEKEGEVFGGRSPGWLVVSSVGVVLGLTAGAVLAYFAFSQGDGGTERGESTEWTVEDARAFQEFPIYWVGERFGEWGLSSVIRYEYEPPAGSTRESAESTVVFIYGRCEIEPGVEGGCPPPLSIRIEPYCGARPDLVSDVVKQGEVFPFRGAQAQRMIGHLRIWTDDVSISVFGEEDVVTQAAQELRRIDASDQNPPYPDLPPPDPTGC